MAPHAIPNGATNGEDRPLTILVTGFGPFQDKFPVNPSYEITKSLPAILPKSASGTSKPIRIIAHSPPIRVCYAESRTLIPKLLDSLADEVDLVLHIGMASGRQFYAAEHYAHRSDYQKHKDLDGDVPPATEPVELFADCPDRMSTSLDYDDVVSRWQKNVEALGEGVPGAGADCRVSEDAGHYLCDYTYFQTLAWFGRRNGSMEGEKAKDRPAVFLHVPAESDASMLEKGGAVAVALIRAMADSYTSGDESRS